MKYIDADKLTELISQTEKEFTEKSETKGYTTLEYQLKAEGLHLALQYITYLQQEQPEVDLITEYDEQFDSSPLYGKLVNRNAGIAIARHFWNKGFNARKEE